MPKSSAGVRALREQAMWRVLASFARTRLSQAEFCRREGVPLSTFLYWRRRLTGNPAGVAPFVEVEVVGDSPAVVIEVAVGGDVVVRLPASAGEELLGRVLRAARGSC